MDRAEKMKKYRKEMAHADPFRQGSPAPGTGIPVKGLLAAGVIGIVILGLFFFMLYHKKEESDLTYVTQEEFASLMSFLGDGLLQKQPDQEPDSSITYGQLKDAIQAVGLSGTISVNGGAEKLKREVLIDYYTQILDYLDLEESVTRKTILLLEQDKQNCWTQDGKVKCSGDFLHLHPCFTYDVFLANGTLLGVAGKSNQTVALKGVKINAVADKTLSFTYKKREYEVSCTDTDNLSDGATCTLCIKGGKVTKVKDLKGGKQEAQTEKKTEKQTGTNVSENVRVLLLNKNAVYYDQIYVTCSTKCNVTQKKKKKTYQKSKIVDIKKLKLKKGEYVQLTPAAGIGQLFLADAKGKTISNGYFGRFDIYRDAGGYYIVNQVPVEKYLYSVVASEMPSYFAKEALKAQAVCARSYVYQQMAAGDYQKYHAQIDDSTNYQVYNKSQSCEADVQAVEETAGQVMYAQDAIVTAYYYSSSCGYGSGMEIWNQDSSDYPYLKAKTLDPSGQNRSFDMSKEKDFRSFITSKQKKSYDDASMYYRWNARVELSSRQKELCQTIRERSKISPQNFAFYAVTGNKTKKVSSMDGFGGVKTMSCKKRSKSGAILALTIAFEFGKVEIKSEYNIRSIVGCTLEQITYADGSANETARFLPSAYFSIAYEKKSGRYVLSGGGNGHGIGMSQYGADGMAKAGWDYKKILRFYYDGVTIKKLGQQGG